MHLYWLIPFFPLLGFLITGLGFRSIPGKMAGIIASTTVFLSFLLSVFAFRELATVQSTISSSLFDWMVSGDMKIGFSFRLDPLSGLMLLVVTGVGFLIHVYSIGYMKHDEGINRFFSYMNLFMFSMLILVMASNFLVMFIGWEGVGLCSYLLIGFWFRDHSNNNAAKKAFIMNRIGDLGFLLAIFIIFITFGSLEFNEVLDKAAGMQAGSMLMVAITLLLFMGATGKSAQIPLFTWLPDAMAGPTPVSALIHAATMVTAGVYMVARCSTLFLLAPFTMNVIAITGLATAILAAIIALRQNDIKKILAYSTISQLGYMFLGLGVGAFTGAIFHLVTHAFFKALLFLGAGSVIHALSNQQDIREIGGLSKYMKITSGTFLLATLAISGIPPLSGFFSKDEILIDVFRSSHTLWAIGIFGAFLTAFYMFRLYFIVFTGNYRGGNQNLKHIHESPRVMSIPLIILGILAVIGGMINIPAILGGNLHLYHFLDPVFNRSGNAFHVPVDSSDDWLLIGVTLIITLVAIIAAWWKYAGQKIGAPIIERPEHGLKYLVSRKFLIDELYDYIAVKPFLLLSDSFHRFVELKIIDGIVNGIGNLIIRAGNTFRLVQTGNTGFYMFMMVIGIILILFLNLII
jgi:NADH-quinone oxidoreductase subunit L